VRVLFMVFVLFYLVSDHAPWWIWALALVAAAYDLWKERK
jgi:hypothetical protein